MMKNPLKVLIISCWSILLVMVCLKPLLSDQLLAGTNNQTFINVCEYIETSIWLSLPIYLLVNVTTTSLYFMAVFQWRKINWKFTIFLIIYTTLKVFLYNATWQIVFFIFDIILMVVYPILKDKTLWRRALLGFVLNFTFQIISQFLKLDNAKYFDKYLVTGIITSIDYYIMLILYYLYSIRRKEVPYNG